jgi:hypothetical protein
MVWYGSLDEEEGCKERLIRFRLMGVDDVNAPIADYCIAR